MTMTLSAFQGSESLRSQVIQQLRNCVEAQRVVPGSVAWDGEKGSVVGCIIESDDAAQWESRLGLPQWLAVTLDALCSQQPTVVESRDLAVSALNAIRLGADLRFAGSAMILGVFDCIVSESRAPLSKALDDALHSVRALHEKAAAGHPVGAAEWRAARKSATALTDILEDKWKQACAECIETAAWDPQRSRAVVFDTLRVWRNALMGRASREYGWDEHSDEMMRALLQSLFERYVRDAPEPQPTVFDMLAVHHPEEDARLRGKYRAEKEAASASLGHVGSVLLKVLGST